MILRIKKIQEERVKDILVRMGYPKDKFLVKGGIQLLLKKWQDFVEECEKGYELSINDYLYDLEWRDIIRDVITEIRDDKDFVKSVLDEIAPHDKRFKALLVEAHKCIWGSTNAKNFLPKKKYFQYWGIVKNAKGQLLEDLQSSEFDYYKSRRGWKMIKSEVFHQRILVWLVITFLLGSSFFSVVYADDESFVLGATTSLGVGTAQFTSNILSGAPAFQNVFNPVARGTDFVVGSALYAGGAAIGYGAGVLRGGAITNAYKTALEGGKHTGMIRQYSGKSNAELTRAMRSYEKQISIHQDKIANPEKYIPRWSQPSFQHQENQIRNWVDEVKKFTEQREIVKGILESRNVK